MGLVRPQAGDPRIVFPGEWGKGMAERDFYYPGNRKETHYLWWWTKGDPVLVFGVTKDREVVVVRQFRAGANNFMLEIPGGIPKKGEDPRRAGEREFLEETGYKPREITNLHCTSYIDAPSLNVKCVFLLGTDCEKVGEPELDENEKGTIETVLVPIEKWYEKIWAGEIKDNKAIACSLLVLPHIISGELKFK
ncbi:MAG: NUDIX hydrolase [Candidatus Jorgensenbacteria bacterium]|nr:NUDIX hydrolase [Candidatus Jorgensenbacteria bacterium]